MMKYTYLLLLLLLFGFTGVMAQTVSIENAVKAPGDVAVAVTMTDFTGSNGNVQSIQFQISFDDDLLYFKGIENINPNFASWVFPANGASSPITLSYTNLTGHDISTKVFDLKFGYSGGLGFDGAINFVTTGCEITHNFLSPIAATYNNGSISQTASSAFVDLGTTQQASVTSPVTVDVNMQAPSFSAFTYKIGYDPSKLTFLQATNSVLGGTLIASALNGVITATWSGSYSAPSATNVFDLKFTYNGGGDAAVEFKPGSQITNSVLALVPTTYANSLVQNLPSGSSLSMPPVNTPVDHDILVPVTFVYAGSGFVGSVNMKIGYNNSIVTYKGFTTGTLGTGVVASVANGVITVVWDKSSNTSGLDGTLLNLKFTSIANGNSPLTFNAGTTVTQTNLSNVPLSYNNGSVTVADVTLTGASQASTVCAGSSATINLTGLQPSTTSTVSYSINSVPQTPVAGVVSDGSGAASFSSAALIAGNNGQTLQITGITITSSFPNPSGTFAQNVTLSVNAATVAGSVASAQTICSGTSPADLTLTGNTGNVVNWQSSADAGFTSPATIAGTSTTLTAATIGSLSANTYFRAVVQNGVCASANSSAVLVTVNPVSVGGTVASAQTICSGTSPADLTLTGNTGNVLNWQSSADAGFTSPATIAGTSTTLTGATIGSLSANTYFRAVVQSGVCASANSSAILVTVNPVSVGGTVASAQTICSGTSPADLTLTGNTGNVLNWQSSADAGFTSPATIAGTSTTLTGVTIGSLSANTYFRAVVQSGVCAAANSSAILVTVNPVSVGGTVASAQTICSGTSPADLTLTGNTGNVLNWQSSADAGFTSPATIAGTSTTLTGATIGSLSANTYFRAVVQSGVCASANSASVLITVNPASITSDPTNQTINLGAGTSFSVTATCASSYQWKFSIDGGITYNNLSNGASYTNVTTSSMSLSGAVAIMNGYKYLCVVQPGNVNSLAATLTVNPLTVNVKVNLRGGYNTATHLNTVSLRAKAYFPKNQPYTTAPWNYAGTESVIAVPAAVTDWVLVELRTGTTNATTIMKKAGFVLSNGNIVGTDGVNPITFPGVNVGNYYVVIRHRNHLAVMSATAQPLSSTSVLYDFTSAISQAYGTGTPMVLASDGKAVMIAGDVNSNGTARANGPASVNDQIMITNFCGASTLSIYSTYDVNLDGVARANGPSSVNDQLIIATYLGAVTYTTKVPN